MLPVMKTMRSGLEARKLQGFIRGQLSSPMFELATKVYPIRLIGSVWSHGHNAMMYH